ncbi:MAG: hypothetical protein JRJ26_09205 [Deltaproteobacteria bacterium]|nr:hypothetical protein [Deltaproteobacteria bacterium]
MLDVIGFGAINLDLIYQIDSLSDLSGQGIELQPGRELWAPPEIFSRVLERVKQRGVMKTASGGGSAANTIVALARMGFKTGFIGKVGEDREGRRLRDEMEGVDLRGILVGGASGKCLSILDGNRDRAILLKTGANDTLSADEIDFGYARDARYIHLTSFLAEEPFLAQRALAEQIQPPARISLDPGEVYARRGLTDLLPLLERTFVLFVTEREIHVLTGLDRFQGSRRLLEVGPSMVVCKRGEKGVYFLSRDEEFELPAQSVDVRDNTGAGDVFDAGFLAGLLMGRPLRESASFATRIAAKSLTGYGRTRYPGREDPGFFEGPDS